MSQIIKPGEAAASPEPNAEIWTPETFEKTEGIMDQAKAKANEMADKARGTAEKAQHKAEDLYQQGQETAHHAYERSSEAMHQMQDQAGRAVGAFRDYVQEQDLNHMVEEVSGVIRRHPLPAVLIGLGIGFLLARTTRGQ